MPKTHRMSKSITYTSWIAMKNRCFNPNGSDWADYGGRGVTVCSRWRDSFLNFYQDMGDRPSAKHGIDRIDNNGNYEPGNCRWSLDKIQARNRRSTRFLTFNGERLPVTDWAERIGISKRTLLMRLNLGWSIDKALTEPVIKGRNQNYKPGDHCNAA